MRKILLHNPQAKQNFEMKILISSDIAKRKPTSEIFKSKYFHELILVTIVVQQI